MDTDNDPEIAQIIIPIVDAMHPYIHYSIKIPSNIGLLRGILSLSSHSSFIDNVTMMTTMMGS